MIWRLNLGAYLYTLVCLREGVLYFGTAGKSGDLYAVDARSGKVAFKFKISARSILFGSKVKFCSQIPKMSQFFKRRWSLLKEINLNLAQIRSC